MIEKIVRIEYRDDETKFVYTFQPIEDSLTVKETRDGFEVRYLTYDVDPISPDESGDDDALFLVHYHRDFHVENNLCTDSILGYIYTKNESYDREGAEHLLKDFWIFPVSAYIHSGVFLSLQQGNFCPFDHQGWDTSHVGAICVKKAEYGSGGVEFEHTKEEALTMAESLLQTWNEYLSGSVYSVVKETYDKDKQQIDYDIVSGFYGYDYAKECLKDM